MMPATRSDFALKTVAVVVYASHLDDAVHKLQQSYAVEPDGTHSHDERLTFPCNIIEAVQDGSEPWIMGRLTLLPKADFISLFSATSMTPTISKIAHLAKCRKQMG